VHIVAINKINDLDDASAKRLAEAAGLSVYEAGARLRVAGRFPIVISTFAELGSAEETASRMISAGFDAMVLEQDEIESESNRFAVRKFFLEDEELVFISAYDESLSIGYRSVKLLLRGMSVEQTVETRIEKKRKFNLGKAILTGGLMMTSSKEKKHREVSDKREGFLHIYDRDNNIVVFRENSVDYSSLGPTLKPSRSENFTYVASEFPRWCPEALSNDSLLSRAVQAQILGPIFNPEEHLDIAISLIVKSLG